MKRKIKTTQIKSNASPEKEITKEQLLKLDPIDKLVSIQIDTTLNTLKIFYGFITAAQQGIEKGDFVPALSAASKATPTLESLFKRAVAGFQVYSETKQTLEFVIKPVDPDEPDKPDGYNIDDIYKTILNTHGNA